MYIFLYIFRCDVGHKYNQIRFCQAGTISTRQVHRREFRNKNSKDLKDNVVKCRLAKYWYKNHPDVDQSSYKEWRIASIKRVDKHSGQVQLVVRIGQKDYLWWCHLDNADEIQPFEATSSYRNDSSSSSPIDRFEFGNSTYFPFSNSSPTFRTS